MQQVNDAQNPLRSVYFTDSNHGYIVGSQDTILKTTNGGVNIKFERNGLAKIAVSDTGIGIPQEKIKTLFDTAFERGEEAKKTFTTGRGVGLYLSSQIIKAHNGRIWAESDGEGSGSTFNIELPVERHEVYSVGPIAQENTFK